MENTRREFIKKSLLLSGAAGLSTFLPASVQRALAIDPQPGSTYLDAEHVVILMQENRSFDHCFGTLQGVRGFNDPRAISLPNGNPVWLQSNAIGKTYAPFRLDIKGSKATWMGALPHGRHDQVDAGNGGKHNQWLEAKKSRRKKEYADLPLTMGYYNRQDIPFNYAFADAFTVCDHNFCSVNTSTFPNRLYLMSGAIREQPGHENQAHIRNPDVTRGGLQWEVFPEVLEKNQISWRIYQNDLSTGGGYKGEEKSWLANYDCNVIEYFSRYHVQFNARYIRSIKAQIHKLPDEIAAFQSKLGKLSSDSDQYRKIQQTIQVKQEVLDKAYEDIKKYTAANFEKLSPEEKNLYHKAFTINKNDPDYDKLDSLVYEDDGQQYTVEVPKGDVLHQFRTDVNNGTLPTVSWLVGPAKFSDHPSSPWYGAWYVSEILDILTKNPEVWKKTIFILTYDENDGYFDHIPPFEPPSPIHPDSGKTSRGIDVDTEFVRLEDELKAGVAKKYARQAPIGLGYRVPMVVASPWSRGGKVCSQVFDHTSTLQFLEGFLSQKTGKDIKCHNISEWRRTVCGDLTSVFRPYHPDAKKPKIDFLSRNSQIESIHKAQFKDVPSGFREVTDLSIPFMSKQERGIRTACALPYQLQVAGKLSPDKKAFEIHLGAGNEVFGKKAAGAPFKIYVPGKYREETSKNNFETARSWNYAVTPGDLISDKWSIGSFEDQTYHLRVYAPNGFYREFIGNVKDPDITVNVSDERNPASGKPTGNLVVRIKSLRKGEGYTVQIKDNAYNTGTIQKKIPSKDMRPGNLSVVLPLEKSFGWYDFTVRITGFDIFEQRFAGHIETGEETYTDPFMGRMI
ncbi:phospholipase C, phosphocholine-specific [Sphingobacterium sp. SGG-5]|uniref:phosphocholine-specific phospholipase C n=1 Tax=Sphingobacterium sp. SGG-5 TaxID=2710881 RepID=UPI0013ED5CCA|nr:phospholipase C, phosphocholine-specific [Sphingobacterium sp. SGG-5]NGM63212.1 phospholipase C, phosphocholine-specific [Sphingobacterium sp. SGG-5]